ncbi:MAG TPA: Shedu anti-phage system protein SduA domain-containing protein [Pyrinomonadaceae bacterium]|jgi:hypothetical protein
MKLWHLAHTEWKNIREKFEKKLNLCRRETDLRKFLTLHPWILSLVFGGDEGEVFSEYLIGSGEHADHMIVHGRSLHLSITLVELKRPQRVILKSNGEPTSDFSAAQRQTTSRLAAINKDRQRFLSELKENLRKLADEKSHSPYQGAIHDNFFDVLRFDDLDDFICSGKIIIGRRADETLAERKFRIDFFYRT